MGKLRKDHEPHHNVKHGHARSNSATGRLVSPTYKSWVAMKSRCDGTNPQCKERYHLKGIRYCERWASFENFLADMGERPEGMTLDRIDSSRGYTPENCRWATPKTQSRHMMKISDVQAAIIAKAKFYRGGQSALARELRVHRTTINNLNKGRTVRK